MASFKARIISSNILRRGNNFSPSSSKKLDETNLGSILRLEFKLWTWDLVYFRKLHTLFYLLRDNPTKWSNTLKQFVDKLPTNCFSVFDHFVELAFKGLTFESTFKTLKHITVS